MMERHILTREVESPAGIVTLIDLFGEIDTYSSPTVRERIEQLIDLGKKQLLLNLKGVEYIDSAGLSTLFGVMRRAAQLGGRLQIVNANSQIRKVFHITGLDRVFDLLDDEREAIQNFLPDI